MANLLLLCERHHVAHHAGQFHILLDSNSTLRFISHDGHNLSTPRRHPTGGDTRPLEDEHTGLAPDAATTQWDGQRLNRPYAISVLAQRRQLAAR